MHAAAGHVRRAIAARTLRSCCCCMPVGCNPRAAAAVRVMRWPGSDHWHPRGQVPSAAQCVAHQRHVWHDVMRPACMASSDGLCGWAAHHPPLLQQCRLAVCAGYRLLAKGQCWGGYTLSSCCNQVLVWVAMVKHMFAKGLRSPPLVHHACLMAWLLTARKTSATSVTEHLFCSSTSEKSCSVT